MSSVSQIKAVGTSPDRRDAPSLIEKRDSRGRAANNIALFCDGTHSKIGFQATEKVADWKR